MSYFGRGQDQSDLQLQDAEADVDDDVEGQLSSVLDLPGSTQPLKNERQRSTTSGPPKASVGQRPATSSDVERRSPLSTEHGADKGQRGRDRPARRSFDDIFSPSVLLRHLDSSEQESSARGRGNSTASRENPWNNETPDPHFQWETLLGHMQQDVQSRRRRSAATLKKWGWRTNNRNDNSIKVEDVEDEEEEEERQQQQGNQTTGQGKPERVHPIIDSPATETSNAVSTRDSIPVTKQRMRESPTSGHQKVPRAKTSTGMLGKLAHRKFHPFWLHFVSQKEEVRFLQQTKAASAWVIASFVAAITVIWCLYALLLLGLVEGSRINSVIGLLAAQVLTWCSVFILILIVPPYRWRNPYLWQVTVCIIWLGSALIFSGVHSLICGPSMRPSDVCDDAGCGEDLNLYCETFGESPLPAAFGFLCFITPFALAIFLHLVWHVTMISYLCCGVVTLIFAHKSSDDSSNPVLFFIVALCVYGGLTGFTVWLYEWRLRAQYRTDMNMRLQIGEILAAQPEMDYAEHFKQKLTVITEHIPYMLVEFRPDLSYAFVSPASMDILGYSPNQLLDNPDLSNIKNIHGDDQERLLQALTDAFLSPNKKVFAQFRRLVSSGEYQWMELEGKFLPLSALGRTKGSDQLFAKKVNVPKEELSEREWKLFQALQKILAKFALIGIETSKREQPLETAMRTWRERFTVADRKLKQYRQLLHNATIQLKNGLDYVFKHIEICSSDESANTEANLKSLRASTDKVSWSVDDMQIYLSYLGEGIDQRLKNENPRILVNNLVSKASKLATVRNKILVNNVSRHANPGKTLFPTHSELLKHCINGCLEIALVFSASREIAVGYEESEEQLSFNFIFDSVYEHFIELKEKLLSFYNQPFSEPPPSDTHNLTHQVGLKLYVIVKLCKLFYADISCQDRYQGVYTKFRLTLKLPKKPPRLLIRPDTNNGGVDSPSPPTSNLKGCTSHPLEPVNESARSEAESVPEEKYAPEINTNLANESGYHPGVAWSPTHLEQSNRQSFSGRRQRGSPDHFHRSKSHTPHEVSSTRTSRDIRFDFFGETPQSNQVGQSQSRRDLRPGVRAVQSTRTITTRSPTSHSPSSRSQLRKALSRQFLSDYHLSSARASQSPPENKLQLSSHKVEEEEEEEEHVQQVNEDSLEELGLYGEGKEKSSVRTGGHSPSSSFACKKQEGTVTVFGKSFRKEN